MGKPILVSWSSGKDSAWALHLLRQQPQFTVTGLFTTANEDHQRVAMHAVRLELLRRQAEAVGLPLDILYIPNRCSNAQYDSIMASFVEKAERDGVHHMAFGDLFLEDVRKYREERLQAAGITALFPLWGMPTAELARQMVAEGLRAVLTCVDPRKLPVNRAGRAFDAAFLDELPSGVDACGENGEFHTFVYDGPMLTNPIDIEVGEVIERDGFVFADVLPAGTAI
ncbi:MAG TPA: ATP-binding protein [Burkholderiales bacterium]|nr:ATP-binding protein [Burkholderiales bacterium]